MLSAVVFLPLAGALVIALILRGDRLVRWFAVAVTVADLALAGVVFGMYFQDRAGFRLVEQHTWIEPLNIQYLMAVDGLSAPLVLLTGLLGMSAAFVSWGIQTRVREYFVWLLVLQTAVMGVFVSLDFVLFFIFWELELLPMYMLISIWGSGRKEYSAMKFLIFTVSGSAFMLVGLLVLYFSTGTFDMRELPEQIDLAGKLLVPAATLFFAFFVAFSIKLPVWPVHTWLPDAHTDAPTAVSVMLAGVLLKMGGYGLIRICVTMFPEVTRDYAWLLVTLAVVSILYGATVTLRQTDLKRLIAYSSVSHMGFVMLGISSVGGVAGSVSSVGLNGAAMQMFTHGTITGLLFVVAGLIYERTHTRHIPDLGGLASQMPFTAAVFVVAGLASLGLPGLSGFVSEVLVFIGAFSVWAWPTAAAVIGIILAAGYILWMIQRVLTGPSLERYAQVKEVTIVEAVPMVVLVVAIVVVGLYPGVLIDSFDAAIAPIILEMQFP
ncbi:MAG: NADH-quinone oxidoreductase subunit M [Chloroflexi bacterium]|nr:NADH-quinone oxidoreductase subunit M [Chloroflexota bacterium]